MSKEQFIGAWRLISSEHRNSRGEIVYPFGKEQSGSEKARIIKELGPEKVVAIGNGANDAMMLKEAALGIGVIGDEGCSALVLKEADLVVSNVVDAFGVILHPERLVATLRD